MEDCVLGVVLAVVVSRVLLVRVVFRCCCGCCFAFWTLDALGVVVLLLSATQSTRVQHNRVLLFVLAVVVSRVLLGGFVFRRRCSGFVLFCFGTTSFSACSFLPRCSRVLVVCGCGM